MPAAHRERNNRTGLLVLLRAFPDSVAEFALTTIRGGSCASQGGIRSPRVVRKEVRVRIGLQGIKPMATREELLNRISINPNICFGKPCIRGHRIWVSLILDFLASGMTTPEILEEYPGLAPEDIQACIAYGAEMSRERFVDIPLALPA